MVFCHNQLFLAQNGHKSNPSRLFAKTKLCMALALLDAFVLWINLARGCLWRRQSAPKQQSLFIYRVCWQELVLAHCASPTQHTMVIAVHANRASTK